MRGSGTGSGSCRRPHERDRCAERCCEFGNLAAGVPELLRKLDLEAVLMRGKKPFGRVPLQLMRVDFLVPCDVPAQAFDLLDKPVPKQDGGSLVHTLESLAEGDGCLDQVDVPTVKIWVLFYHGPDDAGRRSPPTRGIACLVFWLASGY